MLALILAGCGSNSSKGPSILLRLQPKAGTTYVYTTVTTTTFNGNSRVDTTPVTTTTTIKVLKSDAQHVQLKETYKEAIEGYTGQKSGVITYSSRYGAERGQAAALYPQRAVSPGDTWTSTQPGAYRSVNLTLVNVETKGGKQYATVKMTTESGAEASGLPAKVSTRTSTDFVIDVATGMFVSSLETEKKETTTLDGNRSATTTVSKMTLDRVQ